MHFEDNKVLLYSAGNYIQSLGIDHDGEEYKKECIYMYNWVTLLHSRNWHNIVSQLYFSTKFKKNHFEETFNTFN